MVSEHPGAKSSVWTHISLNRSPDPNELCAQRRPRLSLAGSPHTLLSYTQFSHEPWGSGVLLCPETDSSRCQWGPGVANSRRLKMHPSRTLAMKGVALTTAVTEPFREVWVCSFRFSVLSLPLARCVHSGFWGRF